MIALKKKGLKNQQGFTIAISFIKPFTRCGAAIWGSDNTTSEKAKNPALVVCESGPQT